MLNAIVLIGRLTADPELRRTPTGKAVTSMRLAVDRGTKDPQGERETDFIDVICWDTLAETVANHLYKGRLVAVNGRLQIRSYTAKDGSGSKRERAEVIANTVRFLDKGPETAKVANTELLADPVDPFSG